MSLKNTDNKLLTRDQFREGVFARDNYKCVVCGEPAVDAHHILERRLWGNGGYYMDNGASVCEKHHLACEATTISVEDIREACGIETIIVPDHLYRDQPYDKWGNPILPNGRRMKGELFNDESVQKILKVGGVLDMFDKYVKYPRTYHLPYSDGYTDDDRTINDLSILNEEEIVITIKMDGENMTMYNDYSHARSLDSRNHVSRNWSKNFHSRIAYNIPEGWRVCAENLWAKHSIKYEDLDSYVMGFSIWNDRNDCLSWDETLEYFQLLDIVPVKVIFRGQFKDFDHNKFLDEYDLDNTEGYVVRTTKGFNYKDFRYHVAKYVRPNHVQSAKHWFFGAEVSKNDLKK